VNAPAPDPAQADSAAAVTTSGVTTSGDLRMRVASSAVMVVLAIAAVAVGGWPFVLFWTAAAVIIAWEWTSIVAGDARLALAGAVAALIAAAAAAGSGAALGALGALAAGALAVAALAPRQRLWSAAGVLYAGILVLAPTLLRQDAVHGAAALFFLFAAVWATDILGYFVGRAVGGPRLALRISPKKTWAGAIGGALGAIAAGVVFAALSGYSIVGSGSMAFILSLVSQGGDLFESAVKRRFGVKDASHVIPGHGGLMDRLDGFIAAVGVAVLIGILRAGPGEAAQGLLLW
jgi:phosphatidate cytidylyltransferase